MTNDKITLAHGGGGKLTNRLIAELIVKELGNEALNKLDDSAVIDVKKGRIAFTTDTYVVQPLFFRGGDIGKLAVCGTVNDLSMNGAKPICISLGLTLEEGFAFDDLKRIIRSVKLAAAEAGVKIVCGDTKVVERGKADGIFINTSGIGEIKARKPISDSNARPGDIVILSGTIGDHGTAVLLERKELKFRAAIKSDCAPLSGMVEKMLKFDIHAMKDPTRGGLANVLNEIACKSNVGIELNEVDIPVREQVRGASELLGLDPLYIANEGKLVAIVPERSAEGVLSAIRSHKYGRDAAIIGRATKGDGGMVFLNTSIGGSRIVDEFSGEQLPRIC